MEGKQRLLVDLFKQVGTKTTAIIPSTWLPNLVATREILSDHGLSEEVQSELVEKLFIISRLKEDQVEKAVEIFNSIGGSDRWQYHLEIDQRISFCGVDGIGYHIHSDGTVETETF